MIYMVGVVTLKTACESQCKPTTLKKKLLYIQFRQNF